ncbi:hypothetical protein IF188_05420 [Microbacterium sp. NEAU-LLC]|uniref:Uncharacterized protein n=1 Tax=Microbacterium helvum TaxID=2773713 RepID=A0ABR8NL60_9MICO|nr:hypothetical protein [Microbacterium helvum]MBD3941138.1 hypothetical protein [Microbacterium helvum]
MNPRTRSVLLVLAAIGGLLVALLGALQLFAPEVVADGLPPSLVAVWLGMPAAGAIAIAAGLAALTVALPALRSRSRAASRRSRTLSTVASLVVALAVAALTPGGTIPVAGYTFVLVVAAGIVASLVLLLIRRPVIGLVVIVVVAAAVVLVSLRLPLGTFAPMVLGRLATSVTFMIVAAAHLVTAAALVAWTVGAPTAGGRCDAWLRRRRRLITVLAALCALPYVALRATWLTPWPLFAPADIADHPDMLMTGLLLGSAMLTGGFLTLSLVLPWADRFPRWLGLIGGRPVPVALAVIPASVVAVLFTAGGVELIVSMAGAFGALEAALIFPFWLWGPLLVAAIRGYALHRAAPFAAPRRDATLGDDRPRAAASTIPDAV